MLKPKLRRLYANINLHLFEIAKLTHQKKEDIVFWIKGAANPADKLAKLDIDRDTVERWISLANQVIYLAWLQQHPDKYLTKLRKELGHTSKEDNRQTNPSKNHQAPSPSIMLVVTKAMYQHTKLKDQHMKLPACKDSLIEINTKDPPTA